MDFKDLAEKRYSCRQFTDKKVDDELIKKIIDTANAAPTAVNRQPFKIFNMKSQKAKEAIGRVTRYTFGADTFLVVGYKEDEGWVRPYDNRPFADVDGSIAATHIMMEIKDLGLDTTWVGYFDAPLLKELCPEMKDYQLIAIFPIGYAHETEGQPSPRHAQRKSTDEIYSELKHQSGRGNQ